MTPSPHLFKNTSEYRGRLANVQQKWENYIERLVREYSDFLLIVCWSPRHVMFSNIHQVNSATFVSQN